MEKLYMVQLTKNELVFLLRSIQVAMKGYEALNAISSEETAALAAKISDIEEVEDDDAPSI